MPGAGPAPVGLARAVLALDTLGAHTVLANQLSEIGPLRVWDDVVRPLVNASPPLARWGATGQGVEIEHLDRPLPKPFCSPRYQASTTTCPCGSSPPCCATAG